MHSFFFYSSIVAGLVAAGLWFWASLTVIPSNLLTWFDPSIISGQEQMRAGLKKVARLNCGAAFATGLAVGFQALAQLFSPS